MMMIENPPRQFAHEKRKEKKRRDDVKKHGREQRTTQAKQRSMMRNQNKMNGDGISPIK
jgi:hypothetical protein